MKTKLIHLYFLISIIGISCTNYHYIPSSHFVPEFQKKGEMAGDISMLPPYYINIYGAYALTGKAGLTAGFHYNYRNWNESTPQNPSDGTNNTVYKGNMFINNFQTSVLWYHNNSHFHSDTQAGLGIGTFNEHTGVKYYGAGGGTFNEYSNAMFGNIYLQQNVVLTWHEKFKPVGGIRLNYHQFIKTVFDKNGVLKPDFPKEFLLFETIPKTGFFFIEPSVSLRYSSEDIHYQLQFVKSFNTAKVDIAHAKNKLFFSIIVKI